MQLPEITEVRGLRVLTTNQLAEMYETPVSNIKMNFSRNRERFVDGKHYISLAGDELKELKDRVTNCYLVGKRTNLLYLWTEKGALLHAKSLNTDKAWEVYDYLVDFYFRAKEERKVPVTVPTYRELREAALAEKKQASKPVTTLYVNVPENPEILGAMAKIQDDLICIRVLIDECKKYLSEEKYKDRRHVTAELVSTLIGDMDKWLRIQPKLVEKHY